MRTFVSVLTSLPQYPGPTEEEQEAFKKLLTAFRNLYAFLAQTLPYQDVDLERLYVYVRLLLNKLPRRPGGPAYDFEDEVALQYYKVHKTFDGPIALQAGVGGTVSGPVAVGTAGKREKMAKLSQIIDHLNQRFGTSFTQADQLFFDQIEQAALENQGLQQAAKVNSIENFRPPVSQRN
jgi:type I restriction enzyme R subunit